MKKMLFMLAALMLITLTSCEKETEKQPLPPDYRQVTVVDVLPVTDYTYLEVEENDIQYWIAVPKMEVEKGATLYFSKSMEMKNFKSSSIDKTFETILFVEDISTALPNSEKGVMPQGMQHPQITPGQKDVISVEPLKDGKTVEQVFAQSKNLAGKTVKVRGKVMKFNAGILDRNWIHIQDGTGTKDDFDLLVTSTDIVDFGDIVVIEGVVAVNKEFGAGYTYAVLVENAIIKKEK